MRRTVKLITAALAAASLAAIPAHAALKRGQSAPLFTTSGAKAGKAESFNLRRALERGPVVLYFFPKAFTRGCTLESNAFAEAMDDFEAAGATVVGLSADDLPTLKRFSTEECRDEFAVARATPAIIKAYDVSLVMNGKQTGLSDRTSYVIAQDGTIAMVYTDGDWREHVSRSLAAVRKLKR
ncbi:peroxiredoxin [Paraurantiacibacter namhicola]|uniref:thioredoxin-dependent peroxiredoxin n=1 Tax=Paraurantiacibacter namhicola TaxID=645517 RepID=A0A1C7D9J3_9SPHN|nr:redoxin domain-containing protein [Paraurantiacibacter namhicola]ANU08118.1 Putative peroxiredoxin bcp [Paraurantiacibacter namhicola]